MGMDREGICWKSISVTDDRLLTGHCGFVCHCRKFPAGWVASSLPRPWAEGNLEKLSLFPATDKPSPSVANFVEAQLGRCLAE
jgi:hypothetical protein